MDWVCPDLAETFMLFKQRMTLMLADEVVNTPGKQVVKIQIAIENEGLKRINASTLTDEDKQDPEKLFKLFEDQLNTSVNFRIHRMDLVTYRQRGK